MPDFTSQILAELGKKNYQPLKPKQLAKRLGIIGDSYSEFRHAVKSLVTEGRIVRGADNTLRPADQFGTLTGVYRRTNSGHGYLRLPMIDGVPQPEIFIRAGRELDASTGDEVEVRLTRRAGRSVDAAGEVIRVVKRATRTFVGTYFEREGEAFVRVDGTVFSHSVLVGDPGAKGGEAAG